MLILSPLLKRFWAIDMDSAPPSELKNMATATINTVRGAAILSTNMVLTPLRHVGWSNSALNSNERSLQGQADAKAGHYLVANPHPRVRVDFESIYQARSYREDG